VAEKNEIVLINKTKGRFTINFQGSFPQNKFAAKDGKFFLSQKEMDFVKATYPHILEGKEKCLYLEDELSSFIEVSGADNETFFAKHHSKVKSAIAKMGEEEAQEKYEYAQLHDVSETIIKALEDHILELDKAKE
jgi:hypothetical protein